MSTFKCCIVSCAVGLLALGWLTPALAAPSEEAIDHQVQTKAQVADAQARQAWRESMVRSEVTEKGCFTADYPSTAWVEVQCQPAVPRAALRPSKAAALVKSVGAPQTVGGAYGDYAIQGNALIQETIGNFPAVSGLTSESSVSTGDGGTLGSNDYTLQINSNKNSTTPPLGDCPARATNCWVWQQFVYATNFTTGTASLYMEYWINGSLGGYCPYPFTLSAGGCVYDSPHVPVPNQPITQLGNMLLAGMASVNTSTCTGCDRITFIGGGKVWTQVVPSVFNLAHWWTQSEFNVFGDGSDSEALFNNGASVSVGVAVIDGTSDTPYCMNFGGTTGETNNLNLSSCATAVNPWPSIEFTEIAPARIWSIY
jgi:hypothetical protein